MADRGRIRRSAGPSLQAALHGPLMGVDHTIPLSAIALPEEEFVGLFEYFLEHPDDRSNLATVTVLDLVH